MRNLALALIGISLLAGCSNNGNDNGKDTGAKAHDTSAQVNTKDSAAEPKVTITTFQTEIGWGYDVDVSGTKLHQPHIPAISGNKGFKTEEDARKTAELVAHKIKNNVMPPSLTVEELDSLGVLK